MINIKKIYNPRLAGYLMFNGCHLLEIKPNTKNPKYKVFIFVENNFLNDQMQNYKQVK
jgi:hypothetical protein